MTTVGEVELQFFGTNPWMGIVSWPLCLRKGKQIQHKEM